MMNHMMLVQPDKIASPTLSPKCGLPFSFNERNNRADFTISPREILATSPNSQLDKSREVRVVHLGTFMNDRGVYQVKKM